MSIIGHRLYEAGRLGDAYRHLYRYACDGDVEAMALLGALMIHGSHKFESWEECEGWWASASDAEKERFRTDNQADVHLAIAWLRSASGAGMWTATHNLAMHLFLTDGEEAQSEYRRLLELSEEQRRIERDGDASLKGNQEPE